MQSLWIYTETFRYLHKSRNRAYAIEEIKSQWAQFILNHLKIDWHFKGIPTTQKSVIFVGNHISYIDMPLIMACASDLSFVAKHELSQWPLFGTAAKAINTVFLKRDSRDSRQQARQMITNALLEGRRVVIFPSGTTSMNESKPWRKGVFEIAREGDFWVQPFRIQYEPARSFAYIDQDLFVHHLWQLAKLKKLKAEIEFHAPVKINSPSQDGLYWQNWSKGH